MNGQGDNQGNNQGNNQGSNGNGSSWGAKIGYIGTGVLIGLVAYPFVRKVLAQVQPKMDKILDELTGRAETMAEKASDMLAKAKHGLSHQEEVSQGTNGGGKEGIHAHSHAQPEDV